MKQFSAVFLMVVVLFGLAIMLILSLPPKDPTLKDILKFHPPSVLPSGNRADQYKKENTPADTTESEIGERHATDQSIKEDIPGEASELKSENKNQIEYYIIVESYKELSIAQQKAERLRHEFKSDFIVLPPSAEGYYRISYGKYLTHDEVKSAIEGVRAKIRPDVWIFSLKK